MTLVSGVVRAQWFGVRSDTLVGATGTRPTPGASDTRAQVPIYQLLAAQSENVGFSGLQVEFSGVAGILLGEAPLREPGSEASRAVGQVVTGFARWQDEKHHIALSLGRQYLFAGAGRAEHLDGLAVQVRPISSLDLSVFGGRTMPWQVDYEPAEGAVGPSNEPFVWSNYAVGGNARFRLLEQTVVSAGFVHEGHGSDTVRQCLTFDAGYWGTRYIQVLAGGILDTVELKPREVWAELVSRPRPGLKLNAGYSYQVPALTIPKTSIFSVFTLDSFQEAALGVHWGIIPLLTVELEGGVRLYEGGPRVGYDIAASARISSDIAGRLAGLRVELLDADGERLLQTRLYGIYTFALGLYGSAEFYILYLTNQHGPEAASVFERRLSNQPLSFGGLALLGYRFTSWFSAQVTGSGFSTPEARYDLRVMGRLTFEGSWGRGGR